MRGLRVLPLLCLLLAAAAPAGAQGGRPAGTLRGVFISDPPTLDPAQATDTTSSAVVRQLFDTLVELDERLHPGPALAERWTVSADQRVYTFVLRPGVKFHNGRVMRAADVKFSFERASRGKRPWVFEKIAGAPAYIKGGAGEIAGVRVVDERRVEVTLEKPFAPFLHLMAYDAAAIVPREETERLGAAFASRPVGTGAFRLKEWRRDDRVVLEAFADHFRGAPHLERVVFRIIPAEITRFNDYKAGNLDFTDIPTGHCRAVKADPALKSQVAIWPTLGTHAVRFNVEKPPFNDRRIRLAVAHAIDPSGVVQGLLEGCVIAGKGILPPALPGYNPAVTAPAFDRAKARQLLAEAGFPGGRGLPPITFNYNTGDLTQRIAELLQAQLREVGITLELRRLDWAAHLKVVDAGAITMFRQGWIADYPDPENFLTVLFHSRNVGAAGNTSRYRSPELDRLFDQADSMPAGPARMKLYQSAEQRLLEDGAWVTLYHYASRALIRPGVKGLERSPLSTAPEFLAPLRKVHLE
jgi:peptide/nickel transport system substrate-binding protein/oligopeptide transport system substrate-binding protein